MQRRRSAAAPPQLRLLFLHAPLRDALLPYLHVCDVYVLRIALPWAKLSVRALEDERNCTTDTRNSMTRYALETCASLSLFRWCYERGIATASDGNIALEYAAASGSVPLFTRMFAERSTTRFIDWSRVLAAASKCIGVEMLRAVANSLPPALNVVAEFADVASKAAAAGRVDVLEFCEQQLGGDTPTTTAAASARWMSSCYVTNWRLRVSRRIVPAAAWNDRVEVFEWMRSRQAGLRFEPELLRIAAPCDASRVLCYLHRLDPSVWDGPLTPTHLAQAATEAAACGANCTAVFRELGVVPQHEHFLIAARHGAFANMTWLACELGVRHRMHDEITHGLGAEAALYVCSRSPDMCAFVLDKQTTEQRAPFLAHMLTVNTVILCTDVLAVALRYTPVNAAPLRMLARKVFTYMARGGSRPMDGIHGLRMLLRHGCGCSVAELLPLCRNKRRRAVLRRLLLQQ